jgi:hypothetical protein
MSGFALTTLSARPLASSDLLFAQRADKAEGICPKVMHFAFFIREREQKSGARKLIIQLVDFRQALLVKFHRNHVAGNTVAAHNSPRCYPEFF